MSYAEKYSKCCSNNNWLPVKETLNFFHDADKEIEELKEKLAECVLKRNLQEVKAQFENNSFKQDLEHVLSEVAEIILDKNRKYGNSALEPKRIFSDADPIEQIKVRIDDKLSRLENQQSDDDEDAELDLLGYLILLRMARAQG